MRLTQVSGGGSFSGTGYVAIPMLGQVNVKVRFSGIQVNTERQLFAGVIETTYDPSGKQIADVKEIYDDVREVITGIIDKLKDLLKDPIKNREEIGAELKKLGDDYSRMIGELPISEEEKKAKLAKLEELKGMTMLASNSDGVDEATITAAAASKKLDEFKAEVKADAEKAKQVNKYAHLALSPSGNIIDKFFRDGKEIQVTLAIARNYTISTISYDKLEYRWDAIQKAYINGSSKVTVKKIDRELNDKVNLFRSRGDGCSYDYVVVPWSGDDEKANDTQATIASKLKLIGNVEWSLSPYDIKDASCSNSFSQELLAQDRKDCAEIEINAGIKNLKEAIKLTDAEKVVSTVNSTCMAAIRNLTYTEIESLINTIAGQTTLKEQSELAILRLMTAIKTGKYADFYTYLEKDSNKVLKHLVAEIDDASIYFLTDKKNYTNFIGALVTMFNQAPSSLEKRWPAKAADFAARMINLNAVDYSSDTSSAFSPRFTSKVNAGEYNESTGNITLNDVYTTYSYNAFYTNGSGVTQTKHTEKITEVSPLTPIILVPNGDKLPLIATALGENSLGNNNYIVPAILLKYKSDKIRNDYIEKGIVTTLDLATIYFSGGTALATKVTWVRRAWAMAEVAGAVGNIAVIAQTVDPNSSLGKAINAYNLGMAVIGVKNVAQGGYKFVSNLPQATKTLLQENKGIRNLLLSQYLDYRIAITKLQNSDGYANLTNEVRQQIIAEKKVFSELADAKNAAKWGVADEVFINGKTKDDILNIEKGKRPQPETYLSSSYIQQYLAKFEQEGIVSRIVLKKDFDKYGIGKPDVGKSEFISTKSEIDEILKLPISEQSRKLGIPVEQLQGGEVLRIDFKLSNKYKVEMPSGNEFGTNELWLPGGKLPDGNLEAIIKTEGMIKDINYTIKTIF